MIPIRRPWAKKKVHPSVTGGLFILSLIATAVIWKLVLTPIAEPAISIVPGVLPKKEEQKVEEVKIPAPEIADVAQNGPTYPNTLSHTDAISLAVVVNKKYRLPSDYVPAVITVRGATLRAEAANALDSLLSGAELDEHAPKVISSYRSYNTQVSVYGGYVAQYGEAQADTFSARPGHSEHQTGLAVDVGNADGSCDLEICFGSTAFGTWVKTNAHLYGFIVRYPEGKESLTGYQYEPWHLRYVGEDIASEVYGTNQTLDQYLGVTAGSY